MPGNDGFTKLLLHCNGVDESTTFVDDSGSVHTVTANGNAQVDTAQKKFGTGSVLFDGVSDYLSIPTSSDFTLDLSQSWTVDFWVRTNKSHIGFENCLHRALGSAPYTGWQLAFNGSGFLGIANNTDSSGGVSLSEKLTTGQWYHIAIVHHKGNDTLKIFLDGVQKSSVTASTSITWTDVTQPLYIGTQQGFESTRTIDGRLDEVRISQNSARWDTNFTPPTDEYNEFDFDGSENLEITDSIEVLDTSAIDFANIGISDNILIRPDNTDASFANKIISINPLIFVTNDSPPEIVKVDTTDPQNLTWLVRSVSGISNAKDVSVNHDNTYIYVAGTSGLVSKIKISDLQDQTLINLNDTDDIETIETNNNFGLIYAGTDNSVGEVYVIDERNTFTIDSDFNCLALQYFKLDSDFNITSAFKLDSAFTALSSQTFKMESDFKCLTKELTPITSLDDIIPIKLEDFRVFIDSVELQNTDLILSSISITHSVGEESRASFQLSRKHDQLNTTLEGVSSVITNQNNVEIKIKGTTEFLGKISELDCQYSDTEYINVNALADEKENTLNKITMSLPGLNSRLSLYDIMIQNPRIFNPYIDPDNEDSPKKYKGIKVNLGEITEQNHIYWRISDNGFHSIGIWDSKQGKYAEAITKGTFNPYQNWTYFWSADVYKLGDIGLGETVGYNFPYIGTSLAPVSEDLWELINASHFRQRTWDDKVSGKISLNNPSPGYIEITKLDTFRRETVITSYNPYTYKYKIVWDYETYYYVGEAPFKEVSVRNGQLITKPKLTDKPSTLAFVTDKSHNHINYAKQVADLEYEILKNINGNILPDTSCTFNLTTDAYLYYQISLLTQINIDNTTQSSIYQNNNGFPVSTKTITITSADRRVSIEADNSKSNKELEVINSQFPDEDDDEYNEEEYIQNIYGKTDMRTKLAVE